MLGSLIAKAIVDERTIDLPFSNSFWKILVDKNIGLAEIKDIDSNILGFIKALEQIKSMKKFIRENVDDEVN